MPAFHRLILAIFALFLMSCEMNSVNKTVIYEPKKEAPTEEEIVTKDFSGIETFQNQNWGLFHRLRETNFDFLFS